MTAPRRVNVLLDAGNGTVGHLLTRARWLNELTGELQRHLTPSVATHCRVANFRSGVLVLQTDSPAWATRLRYHIPMLRETLCERGLDQIRDIRVKVAPAERARCSEQPRKAHLSDRTAELILHAAEASGEPALRDALIRLARRNRE